ncbi:MAG: ECF-type sigma factor [Acidobacteriota bacterium]
MAHPRSSEAATPSAGEVTRLLLAWSGGNERALEELIPLVYGELRREARARLRNERASHTLQPTALVHEVYLRLVDQSRVQWRNRAHFFGVASRVMREVLVDYARARRAAKRGGTRTQISLEDANPATPSRNLDLLDLDLALRRLASLDERQARLVELRVFGGLTIDESAEVLETSAATVSREWRHAETWLHKEMSRPAT